MSPVTALEPLAAGSYRYYYYPHDGDKGRLMDPALLSCPLPPSHKDRLPESVSLLQTKCPQSEKASNNLRIWPNR